MIPIKAFQQKLKKRGISTALFFSTSYANLDPNISYFAKMNAEFCCLIIPASSKPTLILSMMEKTRAKKKSAIKNIIGIKKRAELSEILKQTLSRTAHIGINHNMLTISQFKFLRKTIKNKKWSDINKECSEVRKVKTLGEIQIIKDGCKIADDIFAETIKNFKRFKHEEDVVAFLKLQMSKHNVIESFPPIVASGKNASMPHHNSKGKLQNGFCIIDFGIKYKGYCTDMTRTVYLGKPTTKDIELYNKVLTAQINAINNCTIGKTASKITEETHNDLYTLSKYFTHGLGHGIGIEIHEAPNLKLDNRKESLQENMITTIEPGIYINNKLGIRIEDDVLLTKNGPRILSKSSKNLKLIHI